MFDQTNVITQIILFRFFPASAVNVLNCQRMNNHFFKLRRTILGFKQGEWMIDILTHTYHREELHSHIVNKEDRLKTRRVRLLHTRSVLKYDLKKNTMNSCT